LNKDLIHTIYLAIAFLALFGSSEILYHKLKIQAEYTRKYVHILTGLITLLFPSLVTNHWYILGLCGSFLLILIGSLQFNLLPSINAVERVTRGSILYPFIVYGCFLVYQRFDDPMYYYLPILILATCDPIAALVGKKWHYCQYKIFGHTKTLSGSLSFLIMAMLISMVFLLLVSGLTIKSVLVYSLSVALLSSFSEGISHNGYDNLSIPASVLAGLFIAERICTII
jgi:phytol kinase